MAQVNMEPQEEARRIAAGEKKEEKKPEKVVQGSVKRTKQSPVSTFFKDHLRSIAKYVLEDFIIPTAKDAVVSCVEVAVYGDKKKRSRSSGPYNNYGAYFKSPSSTRQISQRDRATHNFDNVAMDRHEDAGNVLEHLLHLVEAYGNASVADFYDLVGIEQTSADVKWGWTDLREARVRHTRDGWIVDLPRPVYLD